MRASSTTCACEAGRTRQSRVNAHAGPGLNVLACDRQCAWSRNQLPSATGQQAGAGGLDRCKRCMDRKSRWRDPPGACEATAMRRSPGLIPGLLHLSRALRSANSRLSGRRPSRPDSASVAGSGAEQLAGGAACLKRGSYSRVPLHEMHFRWRALTRKGRAALATDSHHRQRARGDPFGEFLQRTERTSI